jgi:hypothetical protein
MKYDNRYRATNKRLRAQYDANTKAYLASIKSSGCALCGYNKCLQALEFHHSGDNKGFTIARFTGGTLAQRDKLREELSKCVLLCANCHREVHAANLETFGRNLRNLPEMVAPELEELPLLRLVNSK